MKGPLLLAAGLALTLASTSAGAGSSIVIRVRSLQGVYRSHDALPQGPSKGDKLEIRDKLFNLVPQFGQPAGALVGSDRATVRYLSKIRARVDAVVSLPGGTLKLSGTWLMKGSAGSSLRVVGGTGRFARAGGTETTAGGSGSARNAPNVYRVRLP